MQCTPHSSAVTSKPSHFCTQIVSTRNFYSAVKSTNTQNKNILEIVIHMAEDEIVDGMSRRAGWGEVRAKSQYCARLVPPAVDKCTRTCHGNNINNQQPLKHVKHLVIPPIKCKSRKNGAGGIVGIKEPPDKEAQIRPWCRPSRKINYRSTLIVAVTAAQPGQ